MTDISPRRLGFGIAAIWALASVILLIVARQNIATLTMWDPDDYMRLQQVRDWLGGQSVFDVTQYRLAPPAGYAMHWSRIVDAPIAALCLILRPLLGPVLAERAAISVVPLLILGGIMAATALATARIADRPTALTAAMLVVAAPLILFQILPLRIDHHGWQTMMGLTAFAALFDRDPRRSGWLSGMAAAVWLAVSLEGLPMVAAIGALLAVRFALAGARDGDDARLRGFVAGLGLGSLLLFAALHGPPAWAERACDAIGPAWFGPFLLTPLLLFALAPRVARRGPAARIAALLAAGGAGLGLLAATAPACLGGPFATLDPLVRAIWYENVLEGMPIWRQPANNAVVLIAFPLVGLAGAIVARATAATPLARRDWTTALLLLLTAFAVSLLVQRAGALAHGLALPGAAALLRRLLDAIGRWRRMPARVLASATALILVTPIGGTGLVGLGLTAFQGQDDAPKPAAATPCSPRCDRFAAVDRLLPAYMLANLDLAPAALVNTRHRFAGSGYHRNVAAIHRVIDAFLSPPDVSRRMMVRTGMRYVLVDPDAGESDTYRKAAPHGLMARLLAGRPPPWLQPVPLAGSPLLLWKRVS
ncbi:MAG: hypothetical protein V4618_16015 [Pseudomonadota bacterium]